MNIWFVILTTFILIFYLESSRKKNEKKVNTSIKNMRLEMQEKINLVCQMVGNDCSENKEDIPELPLNAKKESDRVEYHINELHKPGIYPREFLSKRKSN